MIAGRVLASSLVAVVFLSLEQPVQSTPGPGDRLKISEKSIEVYGFSLSKSLRDEIFLIGETEGFIWSSTLGRGYIAELSLKDDKLYLDTLEIVADFKKYPSGFRKIDLGGSSQFAQWFSGDLIRFFGPRISRGRSYQGRELFKFKKGVLVDKEIVPLQPDPRFGEKPAQPTAPSPPRPKP